VVAIKTSKTSSAGRLARALKRADEKMAPHRASRVAAIDLFCGPWFGGVDVLPGSRDPINQLYYLVQSLLPSLDMTPGASVSATFRLTPFGLKFQAAIDVVLNEIEFGRTVARMILDSLFYQGILFTGLDYKGLANPDADTDGEARPSMFCDCIDFDDYLPDPDATRREAATASSRRAVPLSRSPSACSALPRLFWVVAHCSGTLDRKSVV